MKKLIGQSTSLMTRVGILGLQGCIDPHIEILETLGVPAVRITESGQLSEIDRLIIPGGESTTMLRLLEWSELMRPLRDFAKKKPVWGVCAGSILLAQEVTNPSQQSLGSLQARAERNSYGSQTHSFTGSVKCTFLKDEIEGYFIRAPRLVPLSKEVEILGRYQEEPVLLREKNVLVSAFHVELGSDDRIHRYFLGM